MREGFVRAEQVIDKGVSSRHFQCGVCEYTWSAGGEPPRASENERHAEDRGLDRAGHRIPKKE
jgi:hypothetical protein